MKTFLGIASQAAAVIAAIAGLTPLAILLNPWRRVATASQLDEIYLGANFTRAGIVALVGFILAYVLFRVGSHLKSGSRLATKNEASSMVSS